MRAKIAAPAREAAGTEGVLSAIQAEKHRR
jgi:hypothetical protein